MSIKHWPEQERPREKLIQNGAGALSDAELLAIFLRTGTQGISAVELARSVLSHFGGLRQLLAATREEFCQGFGLGDAKYTQLQAVMEMSRRYLHEQLVKETVFHNADHVKSYLSSQLRHSPREKFVALFLDSQHRLIRYQELFHGTIDSAAVYPREIVKAALINNAAAIIVAHNHPSGVCEPSQSDIHITSRIKKALALIDVALLDHFIVGEGQPLSLAERGYV
ncbi:RadC family protein [Marinomonas mediterranea]|jgi:DNA replication and repair protein RadC|uniref:DNA repair protein RadC n=1 Tax=Marinomonas mediterranea (strain ATCC 700492 / JCM 21426 / NBRC 103028 / MMB-1) TaxID=717774 RepID=F2K091_MARM1|nr:DNA repair protein RadC [Marinomonas mediterranea]ADZ89806.1 DNA repair protein RadC [Marinomonas mediterranea MMB-1]WCN07895.1 DNA repair protein RadC [Marinomonas mediterranea]WCN11990.1 DNA repair protein RadC [Marinomonas mediterranea]WCN16027.1 DNA repair protein RadC [Marinomonas mediterranea MMB-1]